jgi:HPt (histidine-containing phosphotransfer) domain-containing protein
MSTPLLDLSYLFEVSCGDPTYIYEVLSIFLETVPASVETLEQTIRGTDDFEAIHRLAHSLKSSASIIRIRDMYDDVTRIDMLSRESKGKDEIVARLENILINFNKAVPLIEAEKGRNKPADK